MYVAASFALLYTDLSNSPLMIASGQMSLDGLAEDNAVAHVVVRGKTVCVIYL